ncbi:hypothetical protein [Streptomyces sp. NPDC048191]|uniref:hypothetical protein n=1 Tax=Streptomyces sp. NPDC048191 TaxID=3155484 RepID=UPI00340998FA
MAPPPGLLETLTAYPQEQAMKFQMHAAIGYDGTPAPSPLDTHKTAHEFAAALADLFQVEPARVVHDEWRTAPYVWTNVTVSLPAIGTAVFSVDSRKSGADAIRLYLDNRPVPFHWTPDSAGRTLAQAVADYRARQPQSTAKG